MKYIYDEPAVASGDKLIIGDLHIGLSSKLRKSGVKAPSQKEDMVDRLNELIFQTNSKELIILGDLKHGIPWAEWDEEKQLKSFVESIEDRVNLKIVKGNHDASIEDYLDITVEESSGYRDGNEYFLHGHAEPRDEAFDCERIFMSHIHPVVKLTDSLGKTQSKKIWLTGKASKENRETDLVIVPSFNKLLSGADIREGFQGPMEKYVDTDELEISLLDGTQLGKVEKLE